MFGRLKNWLSGPQERDPIVRCGVIERRDGSIDRAEWQKLIESHPALKPLPGQYGTSPFTGEKVLFPRKGVAGCIVDGMEQGTLIHAEGKLHIAGVPQRFCNEIADLLGARVLPKQE